MLVWLLSIDTGDRAAVPPVVEEAMPLPETGDVEFSLDAEFRSPTEGAPVYVLEQRAAPNHRVVRIEPGDGSITTVWPVPEGSLVHSIATSPDGEFLAMAVTDDWREPGNDLVLLELDTGIATTVWVSTDGDLLTDLVWDLDGSAVWATHIDGETVGPDAFRSLAISAATGVVVDEVSLSVSPAPIPGGVAVLRVDPTDSARHSVAVIGGSTVLDVLPDRGSRDLDHLVYDPSRERLLVAALVEHDDDVFALGAPASAHGDHNIASEWFQVSLVDGAQRSADPVELTDTVVYDAAVLFDGSVAFATREGLMLAPAHDPAIVHVVASRAFRKVTG